MKNLILFLLISVSLVGQRKPSDVVDFNNFDYVYAEKLLHEKFDTELGKMFNDSGSFTKDSIACKAIEYQLSHFKNGGTFAHINTKKAKGVLLESVSDRFLYFYKKPMKNYLLESHEVLYFKHYKFSLKDTLKKQYYILDSLYFKIYGGYNFIKTDKFDDNKTYYTYDSKSNYYVTKDENGIIYNTDITYNLIVNEIYECLMKSHPHRLTIISAYKSNMKCYWKIDFMYCENTIKIWSGSVFVELIEFN
jgi:hypothetical protein